MLSAISHVDSRVIFKCYGNRFHQFIQNNDLWIRHQSFKKALRRVVDIRVWLLDRIRMQSLVSWWQHYEAFMGWSFDIVLDVVGVPLSRGSVKPAGHWQRENGFQIQITHPCISASCKTAQFSPDTSANIYVHLSTLIPSVSSKTSRSLRTYTQLSFLHGRMSSLTCSRLLPVRSHQGIQTCTLLKSPDLIVTNVKF